jgi:CheY-like chemotaxis protein
MKRKLNCVLLIDDDEPTNFLNTMIIEEAHCSECIQVKQTGQDALDYLATCGAGACETKKIPCPDLIFLDINMPAMNGWEFLAKYNELEKKHKGDTVVVMLTTSLDPEDEVKARKITGVTDFKHKPLTRKILDDILDTYFSNGEIKQGNHLSNNNF